MIATMTGSWTASIDTYASEQFTTTVAQALALADRVGAQLAPADEARARRHFVTTARYE